MALYGSIDDVDVKAISKSISDTAVDIFIYDTRKDSDGGAWRKRTQHTSWYNETLNTATRGSRREFPAVAVIVAETSKITIYDGDDPDLPMWMVFSANGIIDWATSQQTRLAVSALNGKMTNVGGDGGCIFSFIEDYVYIIYASANYPITSSRTIEGRNDTTSYINVTGQAIDVYVVATYAMNDVAMTVLPNAPIDAATGLPVPTIAVATNSGVSVIKDDGTVVDITDSGAYDRGLAVSFTDDNKIALAQHSNSVGQFAWMYVFDIPSSDLSHTTNARDGALSWFDTRRDNTNNDFHILINPTINDNGDAIQEIISLPNKELAVTCDYGVTKLAEDRPNGTSALGAYITSDYNTGWMNGDIKLATLSDTDATNVTGSSKLTNDLYTNFTASGGGGFTVNGNGTVTVGNGDGVTDAILTSPSFDLVIGKRYIVDIQTSGASGTGIGFYLNGAGGPNLYLWNRRFEFVATQVQNTFFLYRYLGHNGSATLTKAVVREAEADRSVNGNILVNSTGNGLQVFGTVTKSAVATGADLVAYSGFSPGNYLVQPYNTDLNFGTNDFCVMGWINPNNGVGPFFGHGDASNDGFLMTINSLGNFDVGYLSNATGFAGNNGNDGAPLNPNGWSHVVAVSRSQRFYMYVNGKEHNFNWDHGVADWTTRWTDPVTLIGGRTSGYPTSTNIDHFNSTVDLSLFRISATVPSAEQIKKIYEDEKVLFQENAKATLYGSSDSVTALAYDNSTNLLHVGTSAGRSVFHGLRRVDNTTDAVGAAISASNGMVADD